MTNQLIQLSSDFFFFCQSTNRLIKLFQGYSTVKVLPIFQSTSIFIPMKMAGMFKCLSVTEGNVALGPKVQFSVKELYIKYTSLRVMSFKHDKIGMK